MIKKRSNIVRITIGFFIAALHMVPFYIVLMVSLKSKSDLSSKWSPPIGPFLGNYIAALTSGNLPRAMFNTVFVTAFALTLTLIIASLAAYPLARIKSRLSRLITNITLVVMMIPTLSILVPLYITFINLKLINTYIGLILVLTTFGLPLSIFLLSNFIREMPVDLEHAAFIDGCTEIGAYFKIIVPLQAPALASASILTGVKMWNDYRFARYLLQKTQMKTIAVTISQYFNDFASEINIAAAAAILGIIPIVVIFLVLQKHFVSGLSEGALK